MSGLEQTHAASCLGEATVRRLEQGKEGRLPKDLGQREFPFASGDYEGPRSTRCQGQRSSKFRRRRQQVSGVVEPRISFPLWFCSDEIILSLNQNGKTFASLSLRREDSIDDQMVQLLESFRVIGCWSSAGLPRRLI